MLTVTSNWATVTPAGGASVLPGPFGPNSPGSRTGGVQEAIDAVVAAGGGSVTITGGPSQFYSTTSRITFKNGVKVQSDGAILKHVGTDLNPFVTDTSHVYFDGQLLGVPNDLSSLPAKRLSSGEGPSTSVVNSDNVPIVVRVVHKSTKSVALGSAALDNTTGQQIYVIPPGQTLLISWTEAPTVDQLPVNWTLVSCQSSVFDLTGRDNANGVGFLLSANPALGQHDGLRGKGFSACELSLRGDTFAYGAIVGGASAYAVVTNSTVKLVNLLRCSTQFLTLTQYCDDIAWQRVHGQVNAAGANGAVFNSYGGGTTDFGVYNNDFQILSVDVAAGIKGAVGLTFNKNGTSGNPKPNRIHNFFNGSSGEWTTNVSFTLVNNSAVDQGSEVWDYMTPGYWCGGVMSDVYRRPFNLFPPASVTGVSSGATSIASVVVPWGNSLSKQVRVSGWVRILTLGSAALRLDLTYVDEGNVTRTIALPLIDPTAQSVNFVANAAGTAWASLPVLVNVKGGTRLTLASAGRFTGCVYNAGGVAEIMG